jgi:ribosomal protein S18 acetylase RimI-like enzyme
MNKLVYTSMEQDIRMLKAELHHLGLIIPLFDAYRMFYQQSSDLYAASKFLTERLKNHESIIYFATDEQQVTAYGFVQLYTKFSSVNLSKILILNDLYVCENHRKKGIGRLLMARTKEHAIENVFAKIVLETAPTNQIAQSLYFSEGYQIQQSQFLSLTLDLTT